jgi:hypothetical protein
VDNKSGRFCMGIALSDRQINLSPAWRVLVPSALNVCGHFGSNLPSQDYRFQTLDHAWHQRLGTKFSSCGANNGGPAESVIRYLSVGKTGNLDERPAKADFLSSYKATPWEPEA